MKDEADKVLFQATCKCGDKVINLPGEEAAKELVRVAMQALAKLKDPLIDMTRHGYTIEPMPTLEVFSQDKVREEV